MVGLCDALKSWHEHTKRRNAELELLKVDATLAHERRLKREVFDAWMAFVPTQKAEREREERLRSMREQVASWLPDFSAQ